ncbi:Aspartyl protease family protein [Quillaja saponaria]|uniref:Aspartyl protease family protein n=1 Tax=Quillaja saponaria TaxID=32244 RepID=A0AAD7PSH6_QUISA|nr:Aspartyl protease family protein [Quillaja saponaria]
MAKFPIFSLLFSSLALLCLLSFLQQRFAHALVEEEDEESIESYPFHTLELNSLLPSSTCNPSNEGLYKDGGYLKVSHEHGPCSPLKNKKAPTFVEILQRDQARFTRKRKGSASSSSSSIPTRTESTDSDIGNYVVKVGLGAPKQQVTLTVDTGSDLIWTQCKPCPICFKQKDPIFDQSKSPTYSTVSCKTAVCSTKYIKGMEIGCTFPATCTYTVAYGDGSISIGYLSKERLTLTPSDVFNHVLFGCAQNSSGLSFDDSTTDGILGLSPDPLSIYSQATKYSKKFSYCLPSKPTEIGFLKFGPTHPVSKGPFKFTKLYKYIEGDLSYHGIDLIGLKINGIKNPIHFPHPERGSFIDSGAVITRLPPTTYGALRAAYRKLLSKTKYTFIGALGIMDTCYSTGRSKIIETPKISFLFKSGVVLDLPPTGSAVFLNATVFCLPFAPLGSDREAPIFGNTQHKTLEVVYDGKRGKIGFGYGGCK